VSVEIPVAAKAPEGAVAVAADLTRLEENHAVVHQGRAAVLCQSQNRTLQMSVTNVGRLHLKTVNWMTEKVNMMCTMEGKPSPAIANLLVTIVVVLV
jgi:hypothetical protein